MRHGGFRVRDRKHHGFYDFSCQKKTTSRGSTLPLFKGKTEGVRSLSPFKGETQRG